MLDFRAIRFPGLVSAFTLPTGGTSQPAIGSTRAFGVRATDARAYEPANGAG